jgi:hypothetical protein
MTPNITHVIYEIEEFANNFCYRRYEIHSNVDALASIMRLIVNMRRRSWLRRSINSKSRSNSLKRRNILLSRSSELLNTFLKYSTGSRMVIPTMVLLNGWIILSVPETLPLMKSQYNMHLRILTAK